MDTGSNKLASRMINSLTLDEDLRQDLWIAYLSGTPISHLHKEILKIILKYDVQSKDSAAYELFCSDIPLELLDLLSPMEKTTMFLLYLGYNIGEISVTLGESRVVVLELISSIKQHKTWEMLEWHSRDPSQMKRSLA